ncbi:MAG: hypothetical protein HOP33_09065 [Verrucomicrobia bacterium]|nr:hypothetical protein [Verrucomicrobiota bacterium]
MSKSKKSKLDQFAGTLAEMDVEKKTIDEMRAWLKGEGVSVSSGRLSVYLESLRNLKELDQSNDLLEQFQEFTRKKNPDWSPEKVRQTGIDFFVAHTVAKKDANKFATIVTLDQNERFGKTKAAQKDRQLDQQDRKIKLMEQKAAAFDQAKGVMGDQALSEEQRASRMRELFGM